MRVALEGMDGSGKSTIAKMLAPDLGFVHYQQKMVDKYGMDQNFYNHFMKCVRNSNNKKLGTIFYALRCMIDVDEEENDNSIVERSIISLYYFEHENLNDKEWDLLLGLGVIPDLTIILYASVDERIKRIMKRNPNDKDLTNEEALQDGYDIMLEFAKKYDIPYIGIDTTDKSIEEVKIICENIIKGYQKCPDSKKREYREKLNEVYGFDYLYDFGVKIYER